MKQLLAISCSILIAIGIFTGCTQNPAAPEQKKESSNLSSSQEHLSNPMPTKDREGNEITIPSDISRIISTAPSNTEVLVGLGLTEKLVAVDKYSADIDSSFEKVPQINFRDPDAEALLALNPDIIIASGHNRKGDEDPYALIKEAGVCVVYIPSSHSIDGIYEDIRFIAQITGKSEAGEQMIASYQETVNQIKTIAAAIPEAEKKKVYFEIAPAPNLSSFGKNTFLNEFIETVGAENIFADQESWISPDPESVLNANPDVILTNQSFHESAVEEILGRDSFQSIQAVKDKQVFVIDSNASSRPSQNSVLALKQIAKAVYPKYYETL